MRRSLTGAVAITAIIAVPTFMQAQPYYGGGMMGSGMMGYGPGYYAGDRNITTD
ncbi:MULTISPECIES: hypothetical protein [unclassified Bradyrhizobium]|uniref:hypothetical protein n=1 Tax=unclassified Bradyrhizobium TaxID=2631580 RepID=UPI0028E32999|nr:MULTISPECIES: hypothetical protein [unclassified Bradyrhizobium]